MRSDRRADRWRGLAAIILLMVGASARAASPPVPVDLVVTTTDGRVLRLAEYRGRWVLVNLWATWCSSCAAEMQVLSKFAERQQRVAVVGLTDEPLTIDAVRSYLTAHPVSYPIASVDGGRLPAALKPTAFGIGMRPISYLLGPDGAVVERFVGEVDVAKLERQAAAERSR